jgi:putative transposase
MLRRAVPSGAPEQESRRAALAAEENALRPTRQSTLPGQVYFVTSQTWQRRALFQKQSWADLFLETLDSYRGRAYLLHEYVLMPEHFHILITPTVTLERAVQFIKGGFSFKVKKQLDSSMEIWQQGFSDHRIRDVQDYHTHVGYIFRNPVGRRLVELAAHYPYCSAFPGSEKDEAPRWLKPGTHRQTDGAPEGAPLLHSAEAMRSQSDSGDSPEGAPLLSSTDAPRTRSNPCGSPLPQSKEEVVIQSSSKA